MRYIGSKERLLPLLEASIRERTNDEDLTFADLFCGTAVVSSLAKRIGKRVVANDNLRFCYVLARAALELNEIPTFQALMESGEIPQMLSSSLFPSNYEYVLNRLNNLPGKMGFISDEYSPGGTSGKRHERAYFSDENAQKIDAVRFQIDVWEKEGLISQLESCLLIASLIRATNRVANIAGTYGAFLKYWDKRAFNALVLERIPIHTSNHSHQVTCADAQELVEHLPCDILYLDPPYTWRHYGAYYHILETIVRFDEPALSGSTGLRDWQDSKSRFCDRKDAVNALRDLVEAAQCRHIFLSYNSEGLISHDQILSILETRGRPEIIEQEYRRYRSNSGGTQENTVKERLYYVKNN